MRSKPFAVASLLAFGLVPILPPAIHAERSCPLEEALHISVCTDDDPFGAGWEKYWAYFVHGAVVTNPVGACWVFGPGVLECYECDEWNCEETSIVEWALQCGRDGEFWQETVGLACMAYRVAKGLPEQIHTTVEPPGGWS